MKVFTLAFFNGDKILTVLDGWNIYFTKSLYNFSPVISTANISFTTESDWWGWAFYNTLYEANRFSLKQTMLLIDIYCKIDWNCQKIHFMVGELMHYFLEQAVVQTGDVNVWRRELHVQISADVKKRARMFSWRNRRRQRRKWRIIYI